jgi:hypothetical protein
VRKNFRLGDIDADKTSPLLFRSQRIVEHLHTDPLLDLLRQCSGQNRPVERLIPSRLSGANSWLRWCAVSASNAAGVHERVSHVIRSKIAKDVALRDCRGFPEEEAARHVDGARGQRARDTDPLFELCYLVIATELVLRTRNYRKTGTDRRKTSYRGRRWRRACTAWRRAVVNWYLTQKRQPLTSTFKS